MKATKKQSFAIWSQKLYMSAGFGLGICQGFWSTSYFWQLFSNIFLQDSNTKPSQQIWDPITKVFSLLHILFWCGSPWMSAYMFKLCVNIQIYIFQTFSKVPGDLRPRATIIDYTEILCPALAPDCLCQAGPTSGSVVLTFNRTIMKILLLCKSTALWMWTTAHSEYCTSSNSCSAAV